MEDLNKMTGSIITPSLPPIPMAMGTVEHEFMLEYKQQHTTSNTLNILWTSSAQQARRLII